MSTMIRNARVREISTPIREWLLDARAARIYECLRDPGGLLAAYTNRTQLDALLDRHQRGVEDATDRIWRLLCFQIWGDLFLTGRADHYGEGAWQAGACAAGPGS